MDPLAIFTVSALLVVSGSGGNLLFKQVGTEYVDMTQIIPGPLPGTQAQVTIRGLMHNTTLLFSTGDPATFRVVLVGVFHGDIILVVNLPPPFPTLTIQQTDNVSLLKFVGTFTLVSGGLPTLDGLVVSKTVGSITVQIGSLEVSSTVNFTILVMLVGGQIAWVRLLGPAPSVQ